jgi:glutamate/aspartate transport system substrate-binding protein
MKFVVFPGLFVLLFAICLHGEAYGRLAGTLEKIDHSGVIVVGYDESAIPFSYRDDHNRVLGYAQDLVMEVVDAIRVRLSRTDITLRLLPVTAQNRIWLVQNKIIDIDAAAAKNDKEDQQQVSFSNVVFVTGTRLLTNKYSEIHGFPDLKGKNVAVTEGTPAEAWIEELNENEQMGMVIVSTKDDDGSFAALQNGKASAFVSNEVRLAYERARAATPDDWVIAGTPARKEAYSMVLPKGDTEFKELVDVAIGRCEMFGKAQRLYEKWFLSPLPSKGLNLNLPMSDDMERLFRNPSDQALAGCLPRQESVDYR